MRWNSRDDVELLAETPTDSDAFAAFYRRHEEAVLRYFMRRTRDPELAADLTAETFAAALDGVERYRGEGPARAWLFGIARNTLASSVDRGRVEDAARRKLAMPPLVLSDATLDEIRQFESSGAATDLLARLPADQAAAVRAHVLDDETYPEIAGRLGCSESVVRQRVSRGLRGLRGVKGRT